MRESGATRQDVDSMTIPSNRGKDTENGLYIQTHASGGVWCVDVSIGSDEAVVGGCTTCCATGHAAYNQSLLKLEFCCSPPSPLIDPPAALYSRSLLCTYQPPLLPLYLSPAPQPPHSIPIHGSWTKSKYASALSFLWVILVLAHPYQSGIWDICRPILWFLLLRLLMINYLIKIW